MKQQLRLNLFSCLPWAAMLCLAGCGDPKTPRPSGSTASLAETKLEASHREATPDTTDTSDRRLVHLATTAAGLEVKEVTAATVHDIDWMQPRRAAQLEAAISFDVFHDFQFVDQQPESGIRFRHYPVDDAARDYKSAHYDHGNGITIADIDGDDLLDVYLLTQVGGNELWRNLGGGKFENITETSSTALAERISVTASFADLDNDGDPDLLVTTVRGGNALFRNDGDGVFQDITEASGLSYSGHSSSIVCFDFDRDGLLDVFVTNIGKYTIDEEAQATIIEGGDFRYYVALNDAFSGQLKPERFEKSLLYRNLGDNRFENVSEAMGLMDTGWTGAASPIDANGDGWIDLYVLNMQGHDEYYENDQGKRFVRKSREVFPKTPWGSMGIKVFDFDNDGQMDIYVTDMHSDMSQSVPPADEKKKADMQYPESFLLSEGQSLYGNAFYRSNGDGSFQEISDRIGAENYWPWGLSVGDLNADGFEDAFVASSMNYPFRYGVNSLLLNSHGKHFLDSEFVLGVEPRRDGRTSGFCFTIAADEREFLGSAKPYLEAICEGRSGAIDVWGALGTRSSAIFDLDNDGDLDIITNEFNAEPMVLVSNLSEKKEIAFIKIRLVGKQSNRDGLGAKVVVSTKSATYTKVHDGQSGYLSQSSYPLYFGLGDENSVERIEVTWPTGKTQVVADLLAINKLVTVTEE